MKHVLFIIVLGIAFAAPARAELPELVAAEAKKNGCPEHYISRESAFKEIAPGKWRGTVTGWYYLWPTKIMVKKGQRIKVTASGTICYKALSSDLSGNEKMCAAHGGKDPRENKCVGPKGRDWRAWAMTTMVIPRKGGGDGYGYDYKQSFPASVDGEIIFEIDEGAHGQWEPKNCAFYGDNCGSFTVEVEVTDRKPAAK